MGMRFLRFKDGKAKALTLSYDDGVDQDIRLIGILDKYGLKGTFNLTGGRFVPEGTTYPDDQIFGRLMSASQALNLYKNSGHEVAIHGYTHPYLDKLASNHAVYEIIEDRKSLEEMFGTIIRGCAYPFGTTSDTVVEILKLCQIKYARTVVSTEKFDLPQDWLRLPATCHHNNEHLFELADKFVNDTPSRHPWLFYLWGHSYEFDADNNWNVIEEFAQKTGGKDDIWYATNIEIYDYIEAYNSLQTSADGKMIYNPTLLDIWIFDNGNTYCVKSGETITIE